MLRRLDTSPNRTAAWAPTAATSRSSHQYISDEIANCKAWPRSARHLLLGRGGVPAECGAVAADQYPARTDCRLEGFRLHKAAIAVHYLQMVLVIPWSARSWARGRCYLGWPGCECTRASIVSLFLVSAGSARGAAGAVVSSLAAIVGTLAAVRRAVELAPAEAMRPEPPADYRPRSSNARAGPVVPHTPADDLRNLERRPIKALFSVWALRMAVAVLILGGFMLDASATSWISNSGWPSDKTDSHAGRAGRAPRDSRIDTLAGRDAVPAVSLLCPCGFGSGIATSGPAFKGLPTTGCIGCLDDEERDVPLPDRGSVLSANAGAAARCVPGTRSPWKSWKENATCGTSAWHR